MLNVLPDGLHLDLGTTTTIASCVSALKTVIKSGSSKSLVDHSIVSKFIIAALLCKPNLSSLHGIFTYPFKQMISNSLYFLAMKTFFLIIISLARNVSRNLCSYGMSLIIFSLRARLLIVLLSYSKVKHMLPNITGDHFA